jgi:hypothetical protein
VNESHRYLEEEQGDENVRRASVVVVGLGLMTVAACRSRGPRVETETIDGQRVKVEIHDLEYHVASEAFSPEEGYGVGGVAIVTPASPLSDAVHAEPRYASEDIYRGFVRLDRGEGVRIPLVLDAADGQGPPYDLLYMDANNDGDLTNDSVIRRAEVTTDDSGYTSSFFPPVTIELPEESGGPHAVAVMTLYMKQHPISGGEFSHAAVRSSCYREGRVRLGGQDYRVVLLDGDCNGVFNERNPATVDNPHQYGGDQLIVLPDGEKPAELTPDLLAQSMPLGRYVAVGDGVYEVGSEPNGGCLKVYRREVATGPVQVGMKGCRLLFLGEDGPVVIHAGSSEARLPIGKYRLESQRVSRTDDEGRLWVVETYPSTVFVRTASAAGMASRSARGVLEVTADSGPEIPAFGPPLVLSVSASPRGEEVSIGLSVTGERGDPVLSVLVDGTRPPAPSFQVVSAAGKVVAEDQFEYG